MMGKGQSNTWLWQRLEFEHIAVLHFSTKSKPFYWFKSGGYPALQSHKKIVEDAHFFDDTKIQQRADRAYKLWISMLALAFVQIAKRDIFTVWLAQSTTSTIIKAAVQVVFQRCRRVT